MPKFFNILIKIRIKMGGQGKHLLRSQKNSFWKKELACEL